MKEVIKITLICWMVLLGSIAVAQPNFVIIVVDDQGWTGSSLQMDGNLEGSKSDFYYTPEIESMAANGLTFSQGYAPAPKCSPSRNSIMTGKSTARTGFTNTDNNIDTDHILIEPNSETMLDASEITYAEWLKSTGLNYRTAHYGKWHLGSSDDSSPENNGFDYSDGATNNSSGNQGETVQEDPKKIFELTDRSIAFIEQAVADEVPFAIQLSHYAVHDDIEAKQETIDLYNDPTQRPMGTIHDHIEYAAMTEDTDEGIGLLLNRITELGLDENTYVFFISDNGGQMNFTDNTPLAFGKMFISEGGIRVPFVVKGPNVLTNMYNSEPVIAYDLFPTMAELTGSEVALPANMDGQSIASLLTGDSFDRTSPLYFHSPHYENNRNKTPRSAMVSGEMKLVMEYETGNAYLYDLSSDPGESEDLSSLQPDLANDMYLTLRDYLKSVDATMPALDPSHANFSGTGDDVDDDGLLDEWEFEQMLSYTYGASDDPDGDGLSNLTEYNNGTDPLVADSDTPLSINEVVSDLHLYPNPTTGELHLHYDWGNNNDRFKSLKLYNLNAQVVFSSDQWSEKLNLEGIDKGIYLLKMSTVHNQIVQKIVIQ
ncbi:MAG: sulfatase-like hydrolase/transferase [Reichenbachiella sp.]